MAQDSAFLTSLQLTSKLLIHETHLEQQHCRGYWRNLKIGESQTILSDSVNSYDLPLCQALNITNKK